MIDLHTHSTASDGTCSPSEIVSLARELGLRAIALTDHDTVRGLAEAEAAAAGAGVGLVPGIEMSCGFEDGELHILGYYIDRKSRSVQEGLRYFSGKRDERNLEMLRRFSHAGIGISPEELQDGDPGRLVTRPDFGRALMRRGLAVSMQDAFDRYLRYGGEFCPLKTTTFHEILRFMRECGIVSSLAHPMQYHLSPETLGGLVRDMKQEGLCAVEVQHPSCPPGDRPALYSLALENGLLVTGGSDFHGKNKPGVSMGSGRGDLRIEDGILEDLKRFRASL